MALSSVLRILCSEYYIATLAVLSTYLWMRQSLGAQQAHGGSAWGFPVPQGVFGSAGQALANPEWQVGIACLATASFRIYQATTTLDAACFTALAYLQVFVCGATLTFLQDKIIAVHYIAAFLLCFLLLEQPKPRESSNVETLTGALVKKVQAAGSNMTYLVGARSLSPSNAVPVHPCPDLTSRSPMRPHPHYRCSYSCTPPGTCRAPTR
jgi:hypothetical protein